LVDVAKCTQDMATHDAVPNGFSACTGGFIFVVWTDINSPVLEGKILVEDFERIFLVWYR